MAKFCKPFTTIEIRIQGHFQISLKRAKRVGPLKKCLALPKRAQIALNCQICSHWTRKKNPMATNLGWSTWHEKPQLRQQQGRRCVTEIPPSLKLSFHDLIRLVTKPIWRKWRKKTFFSLELWLASSFSPAATLPSVASYYTRQNSAIYAVSWRKSFQHNKEFGKITTLASQSRILHPVFEPSSLEP